MPHLHEKAYMRQTYEANVFKIHVHDVCFKFASPCKQGITDYFADLTCLGCPWHAWANVAFTRSLLNGACSIPSRQSPRSLYHNLLASSGALPSHWLLL